MLELLPQQLVNGLALGALYALVAMGLTLVFGVLLIPNFAHGELYMLGGFISYSLVAVGISFWPAVLVTMLVVALIGIALDWTAYKPIEQAPGLSLMISALAASVILQQIATIIWGTEPRTTPSPVTGVIRAGFITVSHYQIMLFAVLIAAWLAVWYILNRTKLGLSIRAVSQNRDAAALMGIRLDRVRIATVVLGASLGGLAGALLTANFPVYPSVGTLPILKAFVVLVIGGIGNLWGAVIGGLLLGLSEVLVAGYISSQLQDIGAFTILVLILFFRPNGLFGRAEIER